MRRTSRCFRTCAQAAATILAAAGIAWSGTFVSLNGRFVVTYPEDWRQVGFAEVDLVLSMSNAKSDTYAYEAVFALASSPQFQAGPYVILKVDTVGLMARKQIDSVVTGLGQSFGGQVKTVSPADFLAKSIDNNPEYVPEQQLAAVVSSLSDEEKSVKVSILAMKFYDRGIANLYFYAPKSQFEQYKPAFKAMLGSFSTENIEASLPRENVKLASSEKIMENAPDTGTESDGKVWIIVGVLIAISAIAFAVSKKRNRSQR